MKTLFVATAAFAALVMVAPIGKAYAGQCYNTWMPRMLASQPYTPQRVAASNGFANCVSNNMANAYTAAEREDAADDWKFGSAMTTKAKEYLANH